jgi:hypothetical protein
MPANLAMSDHGVTVLPCGDESMLWGLTIQSTLQTCLVLLFDALRHASVGGAQLSRQPKGNSAESEEAGP